MINTSGKTFLWSSSQARITSNSFTWGFRCLNTGWYLTLNVSLLSFPWLFSLSNNPFVRIFLAQSISFPTNIELYPLSRRNLSRSLQCLSKELVPEQMQFNFKAWLYGIPFLQWKGCHKLDCKYWFLSAGLTYKSVSINSSVRDTVTSKKLIEISDHSAVNFMVRCTLLILTINDFNLLFHEKYVINLPPPEI